MDRTRTEVVTWNHMLDVLESKLELICLDVRE